MALDSSNIGFQLLRKCGWKEGTGLGASEQGRLEPIQTQIKNNKCGIGAEMKKKKELFSTEYVSDTQKEKNNRGEKMGSKSMALDSSNIGFQLLRKSGWKEGTGLGASEQGRLEPIQTQIKNNKCGIGADMKKKRELLSTEYFSDTQEEKSEKRPKAISKRLRKMLKEEQRMKEKEFDQAFFRDFWPDNV